MADFRASGLLDRLSTPFVDNSVGKGLSGEREQWIPFTLRLLPKE
jgi:hypothetical protein